jgi:hypothetical protein
MICAETVFRQGLMLGLPEIASPIDKTCSCNVIEKIRAGAVSAGLLALLERLTERFEFQVGR